MEFIFMHSGREESCSVGHSFGIIMFITNDRSNYHLINSHIYIDRF